MNIHRAKRRWTPKPGAPEAFIRFFAIEYQQKLDQVRIPGMSNPSWDRKAAWLLWKATSGKET